MINTLDTPLSDIKRIKPAYQKRLLKLGTKTIRDLLYHFPHRYEDFSQVTPISELKLNETATIQGKITAIQNIRTWRKRIIVTEAFLDDGSGIIKAIWFNQPFLTKTLKPDQTVSLAGKVSFDQTLYLSNPAYEKILVNSNQRQENFAAGTLKPTSGQGLSEAKERGGLASKISLAGRNFTLPEAKFSSHPTLRHTGRLVPVYPETAGLSSRYLRYLIQLFSPLINQFQDWLPPAIKKQQKLPDIKESLRQIHFPSSLASAQNAKKRLAFDEIFLLQLFTLQQKIKWQSRPSIKIPFKQPLIKNFVWRLPFKLTEAQRRAAWEILQDLDKTRPMNRLLEGDVGSGKTVVAALAALEAAQAGWQVAIMAPTEILAQQHFQSLTSLLADSRILIGLLTSSDSRLFSKSQLVSLSKKEFSAKTKLGEIKIVVGTHSLIQEKVDFKNLALAVVDEQHRFGVQQRAALQKGMQKIKDGLAETIPHLLSMTATPIPRTLALTIFGDLDISLLDEIPQGRPQIITEIVPPSRRRVTDDFIRQQIRAGRQVFVICPRIEGKNEQKEVKAKMRKCENETKNNHSLSPLPPYHTPTSPTSFSPLKDEVKAVKEEYEKLSKTIFPDRRLAMLHGKMKPKEKEKIMRQFRDGQYDILVSTSVVEVGIDIPNASVMMIEGAERFGLAQLYQFRGRVGRGPHQSYCFLLTDSASSKTASRLKAILTAKNSFELAEKDLQLRGPGEFFGTRQWGLPDLSMASLTDLTLIKQARAAAANLLNQDPQLKNYPLLQKKLGAFCSTVHLE